MFPYQNNPWVSMVHTGINWVLHVYFVSYKLLLCSLVIFCGCTESDLMRSCLLPSFGLCSSCFSVVFGTLPVKWMQISEWSPGFAKSHAKACVVPESAFWQTTGKAFLCEMNKKIGYSCLGLVPCYTEVPQGWDSENLSSLLGCAASINFGPGWVA